MPTTKHPRGVIPQRILLLIDCFGVLGAVGGYGQSALAKELHISPQIIRRRAADARMGRVCRGMPIDQVKALCEVAAREIAPLREVKWQEIVAWTIGLDDLHSMKAKIKSIEAWMVATDTRKMSEETAA